MSPFDSLFVEYNQVAKKIYDACLELAVTDVDVMISTAHTYGPCGEWEIGEIIVANVIGLGKYDDMALEGRVVSCLPQVLKECFPNAKTTGCQILSDRTKWVVFS